MTRAFLSLGSNLGDRISYLRATVGALERGPHLEVRGVSRVYETAPVEVAEEQPEYLNCVVELRCGMPAVELLRYCQGIEAALGRERKGEKVPRTIDVDVLLFGEEILEEPDFEVPHRGILRAFNLRGLAERDADLYIPGRGTVGDLLDGADTRGVAGYGEGI